MGSRTERPWNRGRLPPTVLDPKRTLRNKAGVRDNFAPGGIVRTAAWLWLLDFDTVFEKVMIDHAITPADEELPMW